MLIVFLDGGVVNMASPIACCLIVSDVMSLLEYVSICVSHNASLTIVPHAC